jgi:hypothetical protein
MRLPWLYFCYPFDASVVNLVTLSIPYGSCHSVFVDDFKFNKDSIFDDDLWITSDIAFFTIPCVNHDSSFAIDLIRRSSIPLQCRFHTSAVTQFSLMISMSIETQFSLAIYESAMTWLFWQLHASAITLVLLSIGYVIFEFSDAVDSIRRLSLSIHWHFQVLHGLCFRWWFIDL